MDTINALTTYIQKLNHPLKEIRERSLQLLIAKLHLGWELEDELENTRKLLEALLTWFYVTNPSLQKEALELLLATIKTKAGTYVVKEFGIKEILSNLNKFVDNLDNDALEVHQDIVNTLKFINTVESNDNILVPRLPLSELNSLASNSSTNGSTQQGFCTSKETSVSGDCNYSNLDKVIDGVRVLLFPWINLSPTDLKTMMLVEGALKLLTSTRRCCRFIRDVFLSDFPSEIFLNRPTIVTTLTAISDGNRGGRPIEALLVLVCLTKALNMRILELCSIDFIHESKQSSVDDKDSEDDINVELQNIAGINGVLGSSRQEDSLAALRQLPAPIYALNTLQTVLSMMSRNITLVVPADKIETLSAKEVNICLSLVDSLVQLLLACVTQSFWCVDHCQKIYRDIVHKSNCIMRTMGDLLIKYRKSFFDDTQRISHRVVWLRLVICSQQLLNWSKESVMPSTSLIIAMQAAQLDPAIEIFYPEIGGKINEILQNSKVSVDQEFKNKYRELKKLFTSMVVFNRLMKNKNNCTSSNKVFSCIKKSLPFLEIMQNETILSDISDILLRSIKDFDMDDSDWSTARSITICLMAHSAEWIQVTFYKKLAGMVKGILMSQDSSQINNEKGLILLCDVGVLTELCCHGLSSKCKEIEESATEIMLYLLRGRLMLSDKCWWNLLASLLPVLPLIHVYAAHETQIGKAICKILELDIAECMGISYLETLTGLVRLLFVRCVAVQLESAHYICRILYDERYLPPKESLRADILLNALRRVAPQDFNIDESSSSNTPQASGLIQILDVLKQDMVLADDGLEFVSRITTQPVLEPSLRRSTLQQLAVLMRHQELHETFLQCDGIKVVLGILRMSLTVDDYLAYPECAISCVSVLNSVCFVVRHNLYKIPDILPLLIRVILVFPANDALVLMATQIMAIVCWAGFFLQELDTHRHRVPALPLNVTQRISLPFKVNSYWNTSPNTEHSRAEWLLSEEDWRAAVRVRWWCISCEGNPSSNLFTLPLSPPSPLTVPYAAPVALQPSPRDMTALTASNPLHGCSKALLQLENATSHSQVNEALCTLESYLHLLPSSGIGDEDVSAMPWYHIRRFLCAPPASSRDTALLVNLLQFLKTYLEKVPSAGKKTSWIKSYFLGTDATITSLLKKEDLFQGQTSADGIEVTQLNIYIVKIISLCVKDMDFSNNNDDNYIMENLLKMLIGCLEEINLKNFHMLGYLIELMRCIKHILHLHKCKLSEETLMTCLKVITNTLSGCASGGGRKGLAIRLDATLGLLALLRQIHRRDIPIQRWSEVWNIEVMRVVVHCSTGVCARLRAAALHVMGALSYSAHLLPHLLQAIQEESLSQFAATIISQRGEANAVRSAAFDILVAIASRASPKSNALEHQVFEDLNNNNFLETCLDILVEFGNMQEYTYTIEPNISLVEMERLSEFEVRAQKGSDIRISPLRGNLHIKPPPTANLVVALADALYNMSAFTHYPAQEWNDRGLYRLLFRCSSWAKGSKEENIKVQSAVNRTLFAATSYKAVRTALAGTKDCLHNFLMTMTPLDLEGDNLDCVLMRKESFLLLAALLSERAAAESVWSYLMEQSSIYFFELLHQSLQIEEMGLQDAALYCLTQLLQSATRNKKNDKSKNRSFIEFYDNLNSSILHRDDSLKRHRAGYEGSTDVCQPDFMAEEICKVLLGIFQKRSLENKKYKSSEDDGWVLICSCLSSVMASSPRSRVYGLHRCTPLIVLDMLRAVRDHLSIEGKPAEVIRNANHNPVLGTLYWLLTICNATMVECQPTKSTFAEENIAASLNKLWPWCMMTDQLRQAVMNLLHVFTNDCPKAWAAMSTCVGGRNLVLECCNLATKEAARTTHGNDHTLLFLGIDTLRHCLSHQHCRNIIVKSEVLGGVMKMCIRERSRGESGPAVWWARLCEGLARHADGAAALLAHVGGAGAGASGGGALAALGPRTRARLMPALAHAASHHRLTFLQSPELLELLSGTLLTGDTGEVISASRAVWALAANNHKAKLTLRSAGVTAAVNSALQRVKGSSTEAESQCALQLLTYTNTVLQTT